MDKSLLTPNALENDVRLALDEFEYAFRRKYPFVWIATIVVPLAFAVFAVIAVYLHAGPAFTWKLISVCALTFLILGRFVILAGHAGDLNDIGEFMTSEQLFAMVLSMDVIVALLVAFHIGVLFRLPCVGPRVATLVTDGHYVLSNYPGIKRATFAGLAVFVAFPLAATGAVGGSILGRLLGMSRSATFAATIAGCLVGNGTMYVASDTLNRYLDKDHPIVKFGGLAVMLLVIVALEWRYRAMKRHQVA